jgi:hypothetical protein
LKGFCGLIGFLERVQCLEKCKKDAEYYDSIPIHQFCPRRNKTVSNLKSGKKCIIFGRIWNQEPRFLMSPHFECIGSSQASRLFESWFKKKVKLTE